MPSIKDFSNVKGGGESKGGKLNQNVLTDRIKIMSHGPGQGCVKNIEKMCQRLLCMMVPQLQFNGAVPIFRVASKDTLNETNLEIGWHGPPPPPSPRTLTYPQTLSHPGGRLCPSHYYSNPLGFSDLPTVLLRNCSFVTRGRPPAVLLLVTYHETMSLLKKGFTVSWGKIFNLFQSEYLHSFFKVAPKYCGL